MGLLAHYSTAVSQNAYDIALGGLVILILFQASCWAYNILLHPLKDYPGPLLARASNLYQIYWAFWGQYPQHMKIVHDRYGPILRIGPNELSFITAEAFPDIQGSRTSDGRHRSTEFATDPARKLQTDLENDMIGASQGNHRRMKSVIQQGFSEKALRAQEPILQGYITKLVAQLQSRSSVNIVDWFTYITFDIIGDLIYGESFHSLENGSDDPWVTFVFGGIKVFAFVCMIKRMPAWTQPFLFFFVLPFLPKDRKRHEENTLKKTRARIDKGMTDRHDLMDAMLASKGHAHGMKQSEIEGSTITLVVGGAETTATFLSGAMYLLLRHPEKMQKLQAEVRGNFDTEDKVTLAAVSQLPYLDAIISEVLRMYPPSPASLGRRVEPGPGRVSGQIVPEGVICGQKIPPIAANYSVRNFKDPYKFVPERWMGDDTYASDNRAVFQPFNVGPRGCIGKSLAYAEMRLILSRLVWNFDFRLIEPEQDWLDQKNYFLWQKLPLQVKVLPSHK